MNDDQSVRRKDRDGVPGVDRAGEHKDLDEEDRRAP